MPNSQTLQLYFDIAKAPGKNHGEFANDDPMHPSKRWLDQGNVLTPDEDLTISFANQVSVGALVTTHLPPFWQYKDFQGKSLHLTVVIWRTRGPNPATHDSPFTHNNHPPGPGAGNGGRDKTVFDDSYTAGQMAGNTASIPFGIPQLSSGVAGNVDRYRFVIAATLHVLDDTNKERTFTASLDPQMDVGL